MNRLLSALFIIFIFTSCGNSDEKRLNNLIAEATKSVLFIPESYDPVSTECDSLVSNFINDSNIRKSIKILDLVKEAESHRPEIEFNTEEMDYWEGKDADIYGDFSHELKRRTEQQNKSMSKANKLFNELCSDYWKRSDFVGYIVNHRFRAKNNMGNIIFGQMIFILDKDKKTIQSSYSLNDDDFVKFLQMTAAIKEIGKDFRPEDIDIVDICDNIKSVYEI